MAHIYTCRQNTHSQKKKKIFFFKKISKLFIAFIHPTNIFTVKSTQLHNKYFIENWMYHAPTFSGSLFFCPSGGLWGKCYINLSWGLKRQSGQLGVGGSCCWNSYRKARQLKSHLRANFLLLPKEGKMRRVSSSVIPYLWGQ